MSVSANHPILQRSDLTFTIGCCDNSLKTIFICQGLDKLLFKKVLCHELTHAAMFSYDVVLSYEQEELLADLVATYGEEIVDITNDLFCRIHSCKNKKGN